MNQQEERCSGRCTSTNKQGSDLQWRRPDALGKQPDAVGAGRVGQERKHVLSEPRDVYGFRLRKNSIQSSAASTMPMRGK